ncbi:hypothetical protein BGW80DRAFT_1258675 [Lactifluus volemus]|nr:hypothetical protein BGW80DRAFT_1258675 [Lactifluus volemus]
MSSPIHPFLTVALDGLDIHDNPGCQPGYQSGSEPRMPPGLPKRQSPRSSPGYQSTGLDSGRRCRSTPELTGLPKQSGDETAPESPGSSKSCDWKVASDHTALTKGYAAERSQHAMGTASIALQSAEHSEGVYPSSPSDRDSGSPAGPAVAAEADDKYTEDEWPEDPATENPENDDYVPNYTNPGAPHYEDNLDYGLRTGRITPPGQVPRWQQRYLGQAPADIKGKTPSPPPLDHDHDTASDDVSLASPYDLECPYCGSNHPSTTCTTPHTRCLRDTCLVPSNHPFAEPDDQYHVFWQCPMSGEWRTRYH